LSTTSFHVFLGVPLSGSLNHHHHPVLKYVHTIAVYFFFTTSFKLCFLFLTTALVLCKTISHHTHLIYSHFCPMQCQFIVSFQRPHLTSVQYATPCTYVINLSLQQQENIYSSEKGQCTTSYPSRVQLNFSMLKTQEPVIVNDGCIKRCSGPLHPLHTQR